MRRLLASGTLAMVLLISIAGGALAGQPVKTTIWLDGVQVRTILPPAVSPQDGTDPFYMVPGTGGVAAVGPGSAGYHGGHWPPQPAIDFGAQWLAQRLSSGEWRLASG